MYPLSERTRQRIRHDFGHLLRKEGRPVSALDVVNCGRFSWSESVTPRQLSLVLREDKQFSDLGRYLFGLARWGIHKRVFLKEVVAEVLAEIGHPATATAVARQAKGRRAFCPSSAYQGLLSSPAVQDYSFGYYGLKIWKEPAKAYLVSNADFARRAIGRAPIPLRFGRLCERLAIASSGALADELWRTACRLPDALRMPEVRTESTVLILRSCPLERALAATAREEGGHLRAAEVAGKLAERFGALYARFSTATLRQRLRHSRFFAQIGPDQFTLRRKSS